MEIQDAEPGPPGRPCRGAVGLKLAVWRLGWSGSLVPQPAETLLLREEHRHAHVRPEKLTACGEFRGQVPLFL